MGVDLQGKLRMALGSMKDHASIGKAIITHTHDGRGFSDIEIAVVRATGHDHGPIEDKYVHEILFLVSNLPVSVPFLADKISRRLAKTRDRLVAIKTLVLIHRLLRGGNRCFEQGLRNAYFSGYLQLSSLWFRNNPDPSLSFLHNYASYLEERVGWVINQAGKLEPDWSNGPDIESSCKISLFRRLPRCQDLMERVLGCWPTSEFVSTSDNCSLARTAMSNTLKESFQVYTALSEEIETLIEVFFDLPIESRALACEILKRASRQSQQLHDMYEHCKRVVENKKLEYPWVEILTMDHVLALELCIAEPGPQQLPNHVRDLQARRRLLGGGGVGISSPSTSNLFSCRLETKISKIWVVFEDEENENLGMDSAPSNLQEIAYNGREAEVDVQHNNPRACFNPFLTYVQVNAVPEL